MGLEFFLGFNVQTLCDAVLNSYSTKWELIELTDPDIYLEGPKGPDMNCLGRRPKNQG